MSTEEKAFYAAFVKTVYPEAVCSFCKTSNPYLGINGIHYKVYKNCYFSAKNNEFLSTGKTAALAWKNCFLTLMDPKKEIPSESAE